MMRNKNRNAIHTSLPSLVNAEYVLVPDTSSYHNISLSNLYRFLSDSVLCWFVLNKLHHTRRATAATRWTQFSGSHKQPVRRKDFSYRWTVNTGGSRATSKNTQTLDKRNFANTRMTAFPAHYRPLWCRSVAYLAELVKENVCLVKTP